MNQFLAEATNSGHHTHKVETERLSHPVPMTFCSDLSKRFTVLVESYITRSSAYNDNFISLDKLLEFQYLSPTILQDSLLLLYQEIIFLF